MKQSIQKFIAGIILPLLSVFLFSYCKNHTAMTTAMGSNDSTIHVHPGQLFTIKLEAEIGKGFSWKLSDSIFQFVSINQKEKFESGAKSIPGSGGIQIFYFKALKPGKEVIQFLYVQPFVKPVPADAPRKQFIVLIQ